MISLGSERVKSLGLSFSCPLGKLLGRFARPSLTPGKRTRVVAPWFFFSGFFLINQSKFLVRYVDRLADSLQQKLKVAEKLQASCKTMANKRQAATEEQRELEPKLDVIRTRTRETKEQVGERQRFLPPPPHFLRSPQFARGGGRGSRAEGLGGGIVCGGGGGGEVVTLIQQAF